MKSHEEITTNGKSASFIQQVFLGIHALISIHSAYAIMPVKLSRASSPWVAGLRLRSS
jgi:hypothetical protein